MSQEMTPTAAEIQLITMGNYYANLLLRSHDLKKAAADAIKSITTAKAGILKGQVEWPYIARAFAATLEKLEKALAAMPTHAHEPPGLILASDPKLVQSETKSAESGTIPAKSETIGMDEKSEIVAHWAIKTCNPPFVRAQLKDGGQVDIHYPDAHEDRLPAIFREIADRMDGIATPAQVDAAKRKTLEAFFAGEPGAMSERYAIEEVQMEEPEGLDNLASPFSGYLGLVQTIKVCDRMVKSKDFSHAEILEEAKAVCPDAPAFARKLADELDRAQAAHQAQPESAGITEQYRQSVLMAKDFLRCYSKMPADPMQMRGLLVEAWEALHAFHLYAPAIANLNNLEPLHEVGVQALVASTVRSAAEIWEACDRLIRTPKENEALAKSDPDYVERLGET